MHAYYAARAPEYDRVYAKPERQHDGEGNTYHLRRLEDGSTHRVLKNFPSETELRRDLAGLASEIRFHEWQYYWAVEYLVATP
jgi:hypothetical protein